MTPRAPLRAVGVTGTNGKSTTTTLIARALAELASPVFRVTTLGIALVDRQSERELPHEDSWDGFLRAADDAVAAGAKLAAIETTSEALASGFAQRFPLDGGVFTNLTRDHLDAHGSAEHYLASKAQLFVALPPDGFAILNAGDPASALLAEIVPKHARTRSYHVETRGPLVLPPTVRATNLKLTWDGTHAEVTHEASGDRFVLRTRAIGEHFAENGLAALLAAIEMGVPRDVALGALASCPPPSGRFEVVARDPAVVVDYAHTPDAMERTLATARRLADGGRVLVVFGAGGDRDQGKRPQMGAAAAAADHVVITNDNPRTEDPRAIADQIRAGIIGSARVDVVLDRAAAIEFAIDCAGRRDVIVVAGKGHEVTQQLGNEKRPWSDQAIVAEIMKDRA